MCGFTGFLCKEQEIINNSSIVEMLSLQRHRGPDDSGVVGIDTASGFVQETDWTTTRDFEKPVDLLFGFNRLSILDLSNCGHQPMQNKDSNVILMMNGEIYNAFDFTDELISKGYSFKSKTDTEVVLNLYLEYGIEKMLPLLNGMFALAIYDGRINKLFLARDRFGIKPLYFLQTDKTIGFSSEIKSFKGLPHFTFELDEEALHEFMLFRNVINDTLFKGINNITPGTFLSIDTGAFSVTEKTFFDLNDPPTPEKKSFEMQLEEAVKRQMMSDVKLGTQLSGGVDSSLVTYYASRETKKGSLETISIVFEDKKFSEENYIDQVTSQLDLRSHKYVMNADYYLQKLKEASWHLEQPINHPNTIGIYLLSEEAKKHVTVLLSGEGADELLGGYSRFIDLQNPWGRYFLSRLKNRNEGLLEFLNNFRDNAWRIVTASAFGSEKLAKAVYKNYDRKKAIQKRKDIYLKLSGDPLQKHRKYELLTYLPDLLMRQDKMSMAHSIENRVPILDNNFVNKGLSLTREEVIGEVKGQKQGKISLKKLSEKIFGFDFTYRAKQGFGIPLRQFFQDKKFQDLWEFEILPGIRQRKLFDPEPAQEIMNKIQKANSKELDLIWVMTSFELWAQQYLD